VHTGEGQPGRCPFSVGSEMDAKTRDLALLAALSLLCATLAWFADHAIFASIFVALTAIAVLHAAALPHRR
jgi:hypothetical protein